MELLYYIRNVYTYEELEEKHIAVQFFNKKDLKEFVDKAYEYHKGYITVNYVWKEYAIKEYNNSICIVVSKGNIGFCNERYYIDEGYTVRNYKDIYMYWRNE